jgi:hypothetical protein
VSGFGPGGVRAVRLVPLEASRMSGRRRSGSGERQGGAECHDGRGGWMGGCVCVCLSYLYMYVCLRVFVHLTVCFSLLYTMPVSLYGSMFLL